MATITQSTPHLRAPTGGVYVHDLLHDALAQCWRIVERLFSAD